ATLGDVYAARSMIEPLAARLAAQNRPAEASAALRTHVRVQRQSLEAPVEVTRAAADFHRVLMEQCGSQTFALIGVALHDLVATHQALAHRRNQAELEATLKLSRTGIRSRERLADFIGSGEAEQAESHWRSHMTNAGRFLLKDLADTAVVDILEGKL
ncbi:MAG TPA: FCD domain-containing protein, partial [Caulobacteraceae bacterium]|nr:FCD domain-containing protein [Caulobacteraceae bacterium]